MNYALIEKLDWFAGYLENNSEYNKEMDDFLSRYTKASDGSYYLATGEQDEREATTAMDLLMNARGMKTQLTKYENVDKQEMVALMDHVAPTTWVKCLIGVGHRVRHENDANIPSIHVAQVSANYMMKINDFNVRHICDSLPTRPGPTKPTKW